MSVWIYFGIAVFLLFSVVLGLALAVMAHKETEEEENEDLDSR